MPPILPKVVTLIAFSFAPQIEKVYIAKNFRFTVEKINKRASVYTRHT